MLTQEFLDQYKQLNIDQAGVNEIERLDLMSFEPDDAPPSDSRLVLVLVEARLLENIGGGPSTNTLTNKLERLKEDLWLDGFTSRFIEAEVYSGPQHQDGRTVLALRQLFREVWQRQSKFEGVIFIGNFPDPMLVRRWVWRRKNWSVTIDGEEYTQDFLRIVPEGIAGRSDIVLSDMNGNWDSLYVEGPKELESIAVIPEDSWPNNWPQDGETLSSSTFKVEQKEFEDFFWIKDDRYQIVEQTNSQIKIKAWRNCLDPELNQADRSLNNSIARPDIHVSRINPRHIANMPDPNFRDDNGKPLLDSNGNPQPVEISNSHPHDHFTFDPGFERELLIDYLDRNHAFRSGDLAEQINFRPSAAAYPNNDFPAGPVRNYLVEASDNFGQGLAYDDASLLEYVDFIKNSAVLKGVQAHSNPWNSSFGSNYQVSDLEQKTGGNPWRWANTGGDNYKPSFADQNGQADLYVYRSLYHNNALPDDAAAFWIHIGCSVNTPNRAGGVPYTNESYGSFQNAESILFCAKALALVSRAKVFYDRPRGFPQAFGQSLTARFGDGLKEYYERESQDSNLADFDEVSSAKRAYTWSIIGDWTLRMRYYWLEEDCIGFNRDTLHVEHHDDHWTVVEGDGHYMLTAPNQDEAERIIEVINHYNLDQGCYIGRPDASMQYWLTDGKAPTGNMEEEDVLHHNMYNYDLLEEGGRLTITDGRSRVLTCQNYREGANILRVLRKYRFDRRGFVGRPHSSMSYFKSSSVQFVPPVIDVDDFVFERPNLEISF